MSQASPFSGLIEMPQTGPPPGTTDDDVADAESGGSTSSSGGSSGGFKSFWENHQMIMMVIGLGVLLLTAVLVFRKSQSSSNAASNTTAAGGVPTVQTSDTAMAIAQQNTALEALMNAFQKFTDGVGPHNPPSERGIDLAMPVGTPIYSPFSGTVLGRSDYKYATDTSSMWSKNQVQGAYAQTGYNQWGGEVDILTSLHGIGQKVGYIFHLDKLNVTPGQKVNKGDLIGWSGGGKKKNSTKKVGGEEPNKKTPSIFCGGAQKKIRGFYFEK